MTVFVTADHHLGHTNILKFCDRPFEDVDHMDTELVNRWNEVVGRNDMVYYLGDFTLASAGTAAHYLERLVGRITFLTGSHDRWLKYPADRNKYGVFSRHMYVGDIHKIKHQDQYVTLCHYAMRSWPRSFHGSLHLYGHSHGRLPQYGRSLDVGVDCHNFYPISLDSVVKTLLKVDRHGD